MTVHWIKGDPPHRKARLGDKLTEVTEQPGRWAVIGTYASTSSAWSVASRIRRGVLGPGGTWETQVNTCDDDTAALYVRFVTDDTSTS